jgi:hypothetical protein
MYTGHKPARVLINEYGEGQWIASLSINREHTGNSNGARLWIYVNTSSNKRSTYNLSAFIERSGCGTGRCIYTSRGVEASSLGEALDTARLEVLSIVKDLSTCLELTEKDFIELEIERQVDMRRDKESSND